MAAPLYTTASGLLFHAGKILVITVGLPARGKTHISRALERYLRWLGVKTVVISLGDYRRKTVGGAQQLPKDYFTLGEKTPETKRLRQSVSEGCEQTIWKFFEGGGQVVIYDANNGTRKARQTLAEKFDKAGIHVVLLESICDNKEIVEANIRSVKISSPDYKNWDPEEAVKDYYSRINDHEKYYEPVEETHWPFIRIFNVGDKIEVNNIRGYLQSRIIFFLMNIHNKYRTIYFARSGQSLIEHSYKADSDLSPAGWEYAERLKDFVLERRAKALEARGINPAERKLVIWTSARRRAHHTAWPFLTHAAASNPNMSVSAPVSGSATPIIGALHALPPPQSFHALQTLQTSSSTPHLPHLPNQQSVHLASPLMSSPLAYSPHAYSPLTGPHSSPRQHLLALQAPIPALQLPEPATNTPPQTVQAQIRGQGQQTQSQGLGLSLGQGQGFGHGAPPPPPPQLFSSVKVIEKPQMSEINPGVWDGLSPERAQALFPDEWERFLRDPYAFRAPRAESYHDLCVRLEPVLVELEREEEDLLIIGHASVIRCLLSYLIGLPASEIPAIEVARGDLLEVLPASYGVHSQAFHFWDGPGRRGSTGTKGRTGSVGAGGRGKPRTGSGSSLRESVSIVRAESRAREWKEQDGEPDEEDDGAGGGAGVFGDPIVSDAEGDEEDEAGEGESKNFYENYAEDTTGKRKVDVEGEDDNL